MDNARKELERKQQEKEETLAREKERQAAREWWNNPTSSSTITWVHSSGERGVQAGEVRDWDVRVNLSTMANPVDSTIDVEELEEAMDVSLEEITAMEGDLNHLLGEELDTNPMEKGKGRD